MGRERWEIFGKKIKFICEAFCWKLNKMCSHFLRWNRLIQSFCFPCIFLLNIICINRVFSCTREPIFSIWFFFFFVLFICQLILKDDFIWIISSLTNQFVFQLFLHMNPWIFIWNIKNFPVHFPRGTTKHPT